MGKSKKRKEIPAITRYSIFLCFLYDAGNQRNAVAFGRRAHGAILNPIFLLAKSSSKEKVQPLIEFYSLRRIWQNAIF